MLNVKFPIKNYNPDTTLRGKTFVLTFNEGAFEGVSKGHKAVLIDMSGDCEYSGGSETPTKIVGALFQVLKSPDNSTYLDYQIIDGGNSVIDMSTNFLLFCLI